MVSGARIKLKVDWDFEQPEGCLKIEIMTCETSEHVWASHYSHFQPRDITELLCGSGRGQRLTG